MVDPLPTDGLAVATCEREEEEEEGEGVSDGVTTFRRSKRLRSRTGEQNEVPLPAKKPKSTSTKPEEAAATTGDCKSTISSSNIVMILFSER